MIFKVQSEMNLWFILLLSFFPKGLSDQALIIQSIWMTFSVSCEINSVWHWYQRDRFHLVAITVNDIDTIGQWYVHVYEQCSTLSFFAIPSPNTQAGLFIIDSRLIIRHTARLGTPSTSLEDRTLNSLWVCCSCTTCAQHWQLGRGALLELGLELH